MKEILKVNNLIKKFPKAGGEIDDADAISVLKGINFDVEQGEYVGIMPIPFFTPNFISFQKSFF